MSDLGLVELWNSGSSVFITRADDRIRITESVLDSELVTRNGDEVTIWAQNGHVTYRLGERNPWGYFEAERIGGRLKPFTRPGAAV